MSDDSFSTCFGVLEKIIEDLPEDSDSEKMRDLIERKDPKIVEFLQQKFSDNPYITSFISLLKDDLETATTAVNNDSKVKEQLIEIKSSLEQSDQEIVDNVLEFISAEEGSSVEDDPTLPLLLLSLSGKYPNHSQVFIDCSEYLYNNYSFDVSDELSKLLDLRVSSSNEDSLVNASSGDCVLSQPA